ncbi:MAG TPA: ATP-binding protein [Thermoanaerobaculia bacterium]|nr:ATP-binding protein [Thermoanaerobaculia bacterium]
MLDLGALLDELNPWWSDPAIRPGRDHPFRRDLQQRLLRRLLDPEDRRAHLILGPRQVGKTTLLKQLIEDLLELGWPPSRLAYFDFSDDRIIGPLSARQVAEVLPPVPPGGPPRILFLDEITRAERWALWLKQMVDARAYRIVATDSAASLLRHADGESGLGRWDEWQLESFTFGELLAVHNVAAEDPATALTLMPKVFERYLEVGGFPGLIREPSLIEALRRLREDTVSRAILRDLLRFGISLGGVRDLFVYLMQDSGAILNLEQLGGELNVDRRSIGSWLEYLEMTKLVHRLPVRADRPRKRLTSRPRLYAADPGLISAYALPAASSEELRARVFEASVFRHLREVVRGTRAELSYFRVGETEEVDFVLEGEGERTAIEVTSSRVVKLEKRARFERACKRLEPRRRLLIHGGKEQRRVDQLELVPLPVFLLAPENWVLRGGAP